MSPRNAPRRPDVYGVDIGKNIFHVVGLDSDGEADFYLQTLMQGAAVTTERFWRFTNTGFT